MKTKKLIILFAVLFVLFGVLSLILLQLKPSGTVANIYRDGVCIQSIDLSTVTGTQTFTLTDEASGITNTVTVENGRICISEADCPDQVCVETGWISSSLKPIVCLPAKLVIQIEKSGAEDEAAIDAVSG